MLIANPIYDVVFKYLMKDEKVAKLLLGAIIGCEVLEIELRPTEVTVPLGQALTVMRMDFSARIVEEGGSQRLVILELQKAKLPTDIMRFRKYLGSQYGNENNVVRGSGGANVLQEPGVIYRRALPIISIYFLGRPLQHTTAPVVRVNRKYVDVATGEEIKQKEEFIESLTHDSIIIQIPFLSGKRRNELEKLLAVFDQSSVSFDPHFLDVDDEVFPERYRLLFRRLQKAMADANLRNYMDTEDDVVEEYREMQRALNIKEQLLSEKDEAITEKDRTITEKDRAITEKDRAITEKDRVITEREQVIEASTERLHNAIRQLHSGGTVVEELSKIFRLTRKEIDQIVKM